MKRVLSILTMLAILLFVSACLAEIDDVHIVDGMYEEGKDLDAALYTFSCELTDMEHCLVATFAGYDEYKASIESANSLDAIRDHAEKYYLVEAGRTIEILVDKGYILLIKFGSGTLSFKEAIQIEEEQTGIDNDYEELLSVLRSNRFTSGEKLMARVRYLESQEGNLNKAIYNCKVKMIASGLSSDQVDAIFIKAQFGDEIHPFHRVENYSVYCNPTEEADLDNDTVFIDGVIKEYVEDGKKKERLYSMIVEQDNGNRWLVSCAQMYKGKLIGKLRDSDPETHIFAGYKDKAVRIYGQYSGFSKKYKLPIIYIATYGGMVLNEENTLFMTETAAKNMMFSCGLYGFGYLIGADKTITSEGY